MTAARPRFERLSVGTTRPTRGVDGEAGILAGPPDGAGLRAAGDDLRRGARRLRLRQHPPHLHGAARRAQLRAADNPQMLRQTKRALASTGVRVHDIELARISKACTRRTTCRRWRSRPSWARGPCCRASGATSATSTSRSSARSATSPSRSA